MAEIWNAIRNVIISSLESLHSVLSNVFGDQAAWGWAIIALTIIVRIIMIPLAVKQFRSMRAMQGLQPQIKAIQKKYKVDRELMRKDPEQYKAKRQKMGEEMQALYREAGVNPAGGCLPLLAQAPIFLALFRVLDSNPPLSPTLDAMLHADYYFFTPNGEGLQQAVSSSGWPGWLLIVLMAASMVITQRQMMNRNAANADPAQLQQQRIMMIVMPLFLAFISLNLPVGVLLYWVTTNLWQAGQQAFIVHEVRITTSGVTRGPREPNGDTANGAVAKSAPKPTKKATKPAKSTKPDTGANTSKGGRSSQKPSSKSSQKSSQHLPSRRKPGGR